MNEEQTNGKNTEPSLISQEAAERKDLIRRTSIHNLCRSLLTQLNPNLNQDGIESTLFAKDFLTEPQDNLLRWAEQHQKETEKRGVTAAIKIAKYYWEREEDDDIPEKAILLSSLQDHNLKIDPQEKVLLYIDDSKSTPPPPPKEKKARFAFRRRTTPSQDLKPFENPDLYLGELSDERLMYIPNFATEFKEHTANAKNIVIGGHIFTNLDLNCTGSIVINNAIVGENESRGDTYDRAVTLKAGKDIINQNGTVAAKQYESTNLINNDNGTLDYPKYVLRGQKVTITCHNEYRGPDLDATSFSIQDMHTAERTARIATGLVKNEFSIASEPSTDPTTQESTHTERSQTIRIESSTADVEESFEEITPAYVAKPVDSNTETRTYQLKFDEIAKFMTLAGQLHWKIISQAGIRSDLVVTVQKNHIPPKDFD